MRKQKEIVPISPGDKAFFLQFYEEYKRFLYYTAGKYVSSQADCEDLVQDAIVRLLKNIPSLRELNGCKTAKYIVLTVRTAFLDSEKRRHGSNAIYMSDELLETLIKAELLVAEGIPDLSAKMEVEILKNSLQPRDWLVLEGKYILGYSQEELGRLVGVSPDSVRMILWRAKEKARKILHQDQKEV